MSTVTAKVFPDGTSEASRLDQLSAAIWTGGDPDNDLLVASAQALSTVTAEVFPNGTGLASAIDTLQLTVGGTDGTGGLTGSIETVEEIIGDDDGGLSSQYTVKLDTNGAVSGFGLASTTNAAGQTTSEFKVNADKFVLMKSDGDDTYSPFAVYTSATTVNGVTIQPGVYIDGAFIQDATIEAAQVKNATIDDAKISDLSATKLSAGTIDASNITISGTNAAGLSIKSASSGARTEYTSKTIKVFGPTGSLPRVEIGELT